MGGCKRRVAVLIVAVLASVAARITSDALHVPGYYDLTGVILAYEALPLPWALIASLVVPASLTPYYSVYMISFWIYVVSGLVYWFFAKKVRRVYAGSIAVALVYALSWILLYAIVTNTIDYFPAILRMRGFPVLVMDALASIALARIGVEAAERLGSRHSISLKHLAVPVAVLALIIAGSYYVVLDNEWGVTHGFKDYSWLKRFHTKMDFVWLPLGEKGINNYYYPHDRFTQGSTGYQVWIGMYWIQGRHDIADVGLVSQFAIWDQNFWLGAHGCPHPYTYVDVVYNITEINYKGHKAYLMEGGMVTRSDVPPYEEIKLRGFFIVFYDEKHDRTAIIYAAATEENLPKLKQELWSVVESWDIPG